MKVTVSAAMRARDVSRPRPEDEAAAERGEPRRDTGGSAPRSAGGNENHPPAPGARPREEGGDRAARPMRKGGGSGGRPRRKRR